MISLYVKDNISGNVHEVGSDVHDSLIMLEDGALFYHNMQNGDGTYGGLIGGAGYSFCDKDGNTDFNNDEYDLSFPLYYKK